MSGYAKNSLFELGDGTNSVTVKGEFSKSTLKAGSGDDEVSIGTVSSSSIDLGDGDNTLGITKTAKDLTYTGGQGIDDVSVAGTIANSSIDLGGGVNTFKAVKETKKGEVGQKISNTNIYAAGSTTITGGAYVAGKDGNAVELGAGSHNVNLKSISGSKGSQLTMKLGTEGAEKQSLVVGGSVKNLSYHGSKGIDEITVLGAIADSFIDLGSGVNTFKAVKETKKGEVGQKISNTSITGSAAAEGDTTTITAGAYVANKTGKSISIDAGTVNLKSVSGGKDVKAGINLGTGGDGTVTLNAGQVKNASITAGYGSVTLNASALVNSLLDMGTAEGTAAREITVTGKVSQTEITARGGKTTMSVGKTIAGSSFSFGGEDNSLTVGGSVKGLGYTGGAGKDEVKVEGAISASSFDFGEGVNSLTASKADKKGVERGKTISDTDISTAGTGTTTVTANTIKKIKTENTLYLGSGGRMVFLP